MTDLVVERRNNLYIGVTALIMFVLEHGGLSLVGLSLVVVVLLMLLCAH